MLYVSDFLVVLQKERKQDYKNKTYTLILRPFLTGSSKTSRGDGTKGCAEFVIRGSGRVGRIISCYCLTIREVSGVAAKNLLFQPVAN